jgi:hypothetical protein
MDATPFTAGNTGQIFVGSWSEYRARKISDGEEMNRPPNVWTLKRALATAEKVGCALGSCSPRYTPIGIENHPEKTPHELLGKVGDSADGAIGVAVDIGWFGTQAYDAARALEDLSAYLMHVHLKDVLKPDEHETCRYGQGVVPIRECVEMLKRIRYTGSISVEHEPDLYGPTEDCKASLQMLREWLQ